MASIHRDPRYPKGVWYCAYTLASGARTMRSTGTRNKQEARIICEAWAETERAAAKDALSTSRATQIINETLRRVGQEPVTRYKLGAWFEEWLASKTRVSPGLKKRYQFAAAFFLKYLGPGSENRFLDSINERDIRGFAAQLKAQGRAGATVRRIVHSDLANGFHRALKLGKIRFSPIAGVEPEKDEPAFGQQSPRRTFTPQEVAQLVKTARGTDWAGAVLFAYTTGARLGDVANLCWNSIDLENRVVAFRQRKTRTRNSRETVVGLHENFEVWLLHSRAPDDPQGPVFPQLAGRPAGGKRGLSEEFNALVERSGIDVGLICARRGTHGRSRRALSFHSLRHTAASTVFNAAAVKELARRITDHAPDGSLDRYLHRDLEAIRAATALIPKLPNLDTTP
jgi:integrase